jgi:hypothetical protein
MGNLPMHSRPKPLAHGLVARATLGNAMFDFYLELPSWLRTIVAMVVLLTGFGLTSVGYMNRPQFEEVLARDGTVVKVESGGGRGPAAAFRLGMAVSGLGVVLLVTCGKSTAEKNGYNF